MGKYTTVADVGQALIDLIRACAVPEPIQNPQSIGLCAPNERGAFTVGVHLYDISENNESKPTQPIIFPDGSMQNPPLSLSLSYMISIQSKSEVASRAVDEQRIVGKLAQIVNDYVKIPQIYLPASLLQANEGIGLSLKKMDLDEKIKVWSMFDQSYQLSLFCDVGPIFIDSGIIRKPAPRVTKVSLKTDYYK